MGFFARVLALASLLLLGCTGFHQATDEFCPSASSSRALIQVPAVVKQTKARPASHVSVLQGLSGRLVIHSESFGMVTWLLTGCIGTLIVVMIVSIFGCCRAKAGQEEGYRWAGMEAGEKLENCDIAMVFPLFADEAQLTLSGFNVVYTDWTARVDGISQARKIFQELNVKGRSLVQDSELTTWFKDGMTQLEYHAEVRRILARLLTGPEMGFEAEVETADTQLFLKLTMPDKPAEEHASRLNHVMALSDKAFEELGMHRPKDVWGEEIDAYATFSSENAEFFKEVNKNDRLRLLMQAIEKHVAVPELLNQGILVDIFAVHDYMQLWQLAKIWANPWRWYRIPDYADDHAIRNYFGQEFTWQHVWQTYFTRSLVLPAALGILAYCRRFTFSIEKQAWVQIGYAAFMAVWTKVFNTYFEIREARTRHAWGSTQILHRTVYRPGYDKDRENSICDILITMASELSSVGVMLLSVLGTSQLQAWQQDILAGSSDPATKAFFPKVVAMCNAGLIFLLDFTWRKISRFVCRRQNHRTEDDLNSGWIRLFFWPRFFVIFYPFLYTILVKEAVGGKCHMSCVDELEVQLIMYFGLRILVQLIENLCYAANFWCRAPSHLAKTSPVQLQSAALPYDVTTHVLDWTENVMTFAFTASFSLVLPMISGVALLCSLFESRLVSLRNAFYLQRPMPKTAMGIGIWSQILSSIEVAAVLINLAIAIFAMRPLSDYSLSQKWMIFVLSENVFLLMHMVVRAKFMKEPFDIVNAREHNQEVVRRMFSRLVHKHEGIPECPAPDIGPTCRGDDAKTEEQTGSLVAWGLRRLSQLISSSPQGD